MSNLTETADHHKNRSLPTKLPSVLVNRADLKRRQEKDRRDRMQKCEAVREAFLVCQRGEERKREKTRGDERKNIPFSSKKAFSNRASFCVCETSNDSSLDTLSRQ